MTAAMSREWVLPADSTAPATARAAVAEAGVRPAVDASIVVSELVTNAIRHGAAPVILRLRDSAGRLRIEVVNRQRPGAAPLAAAAPFELPAAGVVGGRGLAIIDRLATKWGWDEDEEMTTVWAELDAPSS